MGHIVGAAIVSHHPGLMQCEEFRVLQGAGSDSDLIPGYARVRRRIEAAKPDVVMIFDSHWFTTGYHLVDGGARYEGTYISDEMPWYLHGVPYSYRGHPELAVAIEAVFQRPSRLGEKVRFTLKVERVGGSSVKLWVEGQGPDGLRLRVGMVLAWIDGMKAAPWPAEMRAALESYKETQDA